MHTAQPTTSTTKADHGLSTFYIKTFGCQMNEHDSERMAGILTANGLRPVAEPEEADVLLVNTCSVRYKPDHKAYSDLGRAQAIKRQRPEVVVGITGCVAQSEREAIFRRFPEVDIVLGTRSVPHLWRLIENATESRTRQSALSLGGYNSALPPDMVKHTSSIKAYMTVMEGCDKFCSFCIVPYTRGREYSRPAAEILSEARYLADQGYKEIALLGQNVNSYGLGKQDEPPFWELLRRLDAIDGLERIRFFTSHPRHLTDELIAAMAECEKVCEQLHLPVQSGSDTVLERMNRQYTAGEYLEKVRKLREAVPNIALSCDMIIGFCGETEEDFQQTMDLMEEVRYDVVYSFNYSPRPHTAAIDTYPDDVPAEVKSERLQRFQARQREISLERSSAMVGQTVEVLIEGESRNDANESSGRSRCNRVVNIRGRRLEVGETVAAQVVEGHPNCLIGSLSHR